MESLYGLMFVSDAVALIRRTALKPTTMIIQSRWMSFGCVPHAIENLMLQEEVTRKAAVGIYLISEVEHG